MLGVAARGCVRESVSRKSRGVLEDDCVGWRYRIVTEDVFCMRRMKVVLSEARMTSMRDSVHARENVHCSSEEILTHVYLVCVDVTERWMKPTSRGVGKLVSPRMRSEKEDMGISDIRAPFARLTVRIRVRDLLRSHMLSIELG